MSRRLRLVLGACLALVASCGSTRLAAWESKPGPYDQFDTAELIALDRARVDFDAGRLEAALAGLRELVAADPMNLHVAALLQDVELEWLQAGRRLPELDRALAASTLPDEGSPVVRLRRWYRLRAEASGTARDLVLAARAEDDGIAALLLLDAAIERDTGCVWAHFGRAFVLLQQGEVALCRESLERAIALDPGHPRVRRLEATLLEQTEDLDRARELLVTWVREVANDPRVADSDLVDVNLDLANFDIVSNRPEEALLRIQTVRTTDPAQRARIALLQATAFADMGLYGQALECAREVRNNRPNDYRSWEYEAELLLKAFGDIEGALDAWRMAAELASEQSNVGGSAAGTVLRARVEIARLEQRLAAAAATEEAP